MWSYETLYPGLATMQEFSNSTFLGRDFKRKCQRKYTDQESKYQPLSIIWQESGLTFYVFVKAVRIVFYASLGVMFFDVVYIR